METTVNLLAIVLRLATNEFNRDRISAQGADQAYCQRFFTHPRHCFCGGGVGLQYQKTVLSIVV